ncbi:MAG TPA: type VI secretion system accessory protein TagJ [Lacunisphaera sp.]|nr:type VI secretion system accessory protein TagJ [Lacunisphaera sp.]
MEISAQLSTDEVTKAIREARLAAAKDLLQNKIRAAASDARLRLSLLQLLCVLGEWERVRAQLEVVESLGDENRSWINLLGPALMGESLRREVFAGRTTPLVLGEPSAWIAKLIQALQPGDPTAQARLRAEAFEAAPATPAKVNGEEVPWLADADSRLGPVVEAIMEGKYYWIPFERIRRLSLTVPTDLRHLVWMPGQITWVTGGESPVLIPTRYAGSETSTDDQLRLARKTTWEELTENQYRGLGQRMFAAGERDFPLLEIRTIECAGAGEPAAT